MKIAKIKTREDALTVLGDQNKFADLVNDNRKFLSSIIGKIKNLENYDRDDLFQEAQIALYSALDSYNPEERIKQGKKSASFSTYCYMLIKNEVYHAVNEQNKIINAERSLENFKRFKGSPENPEIDGYNEEKFINKREYFFEDDVIQKIDDENILSRLTSTEQIIFQKKIIEDLTHDEVAKELKMPAATYMTIYYKSFIPKLNSLGYKVTNTVNKRKTKKKSQKV